MTAVGNAVLDPLIPVLQDQVLDNLDSRLFPLWQFCQSRDIKMIIGLKDAPQHLQELLKNHQLRPEILKYLHERRTSIIDGS